MSSQSETELIDELLENIKLTKGLETLGKGRKSCPNCNKTVGARTIVCDCTYSFKSKTLGNKKTISPDKVITDKGGKGKKLCYSCKNYIGARSIICPNCGVDQTKVKQEEKSSENFEITDNKTIDPLYKYLYFFGFNNKMRTIHTPIGTSPVRLTSVEKEDVADWCHKLVTKFRKEENAILLPEALKYWLRFEFPIGTPEFQIISKYIDEWKNELESNC